MRHTQLVLAILAFIALMTFVLPEAKAIPAFARKYETSCQTCHVAFPKLNAFGRAFLNNGYRMPRGDEDLVKRKPISIGAPAWRRLWPNAVWPGDIPRWFPLALMMNFNFNYQPNLDHGAKTDFQTPNEIELLAAGNFGRVFSYFINLEVLEGNEFEGLHRIFAQIHPFGESTLFNVTLGGFETRAVPFSGHRSLTVTNYLINEVSINLHSMLLGELELGGHHGGSGFSLGMTQRGIEVWGAHGFRRGGVEWAIGLVNGNGIGGGGGHHAGGEEEEEGETLDNNSSKDIFWRFSLKLGGMSVTGKDVGPAETNNWRDDSIRIGVFGYHGWSPLDEFERNEKFRRIGVDASIWFWDLNLYGGIWWGRNEGPVVLDEHNGDHVDELLAHGLRAFQENHGDVIGDDLSVLNASFDSQAYFVQADWVIYPWLVAALRWERFTVGDLEVDGRGHLEPAGVLHEGVTRWVPHVTALLRANVKLVLEGVIYTQDELREQNRFFATLFFAF